MEPDFSKLCEFIAAHENDSPDALLLGRNKWPEIDMGIVVNTLRGRVRLSKKVPAWSRNSSLIYPTDLCTQQCSSWETARFKAGVAKSLLRGKSASEASIADLTGGLGVDTFAFASDFGAVLYNEADKTLASAAAWNFSLLGANNIEISNRLVEKGNLQEILGHFKPDIIYLDPARRAMDGRKVFLLEDCSPDILLLKDELLAASPAVIVKLSPMADISKVCEQLGEEVSQVCTVASGGECKELLLVLEAGHSGQPSLCLYEDGTIIRFPSCKDAGTMILPGNPAAFESCTGALLFEPGKALLKAGLFNTPCLQGYTKLGKSTHLYICNGERKLPGKYFKIKEIRPFSSKDIKALAKENLATEVSTHNIPMKAEDLKRRIKASSSQSEHLFACKVDFSEGDPARDYLIFASREAAPKHSSLKLTR